jgi:D-alanyl-lipoteichoic acid acyltransferase DltB (MBOAT superfamily)
MGGTTFDLYRPDFWYVLAVAVLLLASITWPRLRKWVWAAINLTFLGMLLGVPNPDRLSGLIERYDFRDAAVHVAGSGLGMACLGIVAAWLVLQLVQSRKLGVLPLYVAPAAILGLFLLHKTSTETIHNSDRLQDLLGTLHLYSSRVQPLKEVLSGIGFSYVALRLVEALRLTHEGRHPAPDLASTINYLLPFHMLAAGPIQGYADFVAQPAVPPALTASDALIGVERIAHGLFKKYVLAAAVQEAFIPYSRAPFPYLLVEAVVFYVWVYLDFSAYSDITVGAGRLMGVATPENFNRPYVARNLVDFWDRWHMSLSRFIYRNVFVPVQLALVRRTGPQAALGCAAVAFSVSFLLCGLWHELNVRWLLWGAMNAAGLVVVNYYRTLLQRRLRRETFNWYRANRGIKLAMIILTQAYVAATLMVASWP